MGTYVNGDGSITLRGDPLYLPDIVKALENLGVTTAFGDRDPRAVVDLLRQLLPAEDDDPARLSGSGLATFTVEISSYGKVRQQEEAMKALAPFALFGEVDWKNHEMGSMSRDCFLNGLHRKVESRVVFDIPDWPLCSNCQAEGFEGLCDTCQAEAARNVPDRLEALRERLSAPAESEQA